MKTKYKIWLKVAGIVSAIFAILVALTSLCILFNFFGVQKAFNDKLIEMAKSEMYKGDLNFIKFVLVGEMLLACFTNLYSAYIQLSLSNKEYIVVGSTRVLVSVSLFQLLFTSNIFSAIVSCVVGVRLYKSVWNNRSSNKFDAMAHNVEELKLMKNKGLITQEKWEEELNKILESYSHSHLDDSL